MPTSAPRRLAIVLGLLLVIGVGLALAANLSPSNAIDACSNNQTGVLRVVSAPDQCRPTETPITWNVVGPQGPIGTQGPAGPQGPTGPQGAQGPAGTGDIPSSRSYLQSDASIHSSANPYSAPLIDWNQDQYDTLGAVQLGPWRYVAPSAGRYRVSTFIRYRPNGPIAAGQVVQVEVYVNGYDYGGLGGFQAGNDTGGADLFLQGEDEVAAAAGDQITIHVFQNTGQTGSVTVASHVLVARLGN